VQTKFSLTVEATARAAVSDSVYLPGFVESTSDLREDFERAIEEAKQLGPPVPPAPDAQGKNIAPANGQFLGQTLTGVHLKLDGCSNYKNLYPAIAKIFGHPFMREVANAYLGIPNSLNRHLILTHDFRGSADQILPYHFDEMRSLKFYIYVDDTAANGGPFEIIPGTHHGGSFIRMSEWHRVGKYNEIKSWVLDQYPEEYLYSIFGQFKELLKLRSVTLDGDAGTLIIFDTDNLHCGGYFTGDRERRVIRGSSYTGLWP
jgi:hypothetical protein